MTHQLHRPIVVMLVSLLTVWGLAMAGPAEAGQFFERHGAAIDGYDPVAYFEEHRAAKGDPAFTSVYRGATFLFASAAHQALFARNPEQFAPQFGGYCAYGVAEGVKAAIAGEIWEVVEGKLYLNHDPQVQAKWKANRSVLLRDAQANWPSVEFSNTVYQ